VGLRVGQGCEIDDLSTRMSFFRDLGGNMFELSERTGLGPPSIRDTLIVH
jgi:hypothetical protein